MCQYNRQNSPALVGFIYHHQRQERSILYSELIELSFTLSLLYCTLFVSFYKRGIEQANERYFSENISTETNTPQEQTEQNIM